MLEETSGHIGMQENWSQNPGLPAPMLSSMLTLGMTRSTIWPPLALRSLSSESDVMSVAFTLLSEMKDSGEEFSFCFLFPLVVIAKAWDHVETCCNHQETLSTLNSYHPATN